MLKEKRVAAIIESLCDRSFEEKITREVNEADLNKEKEIYTRLELYLRDNPHLLAQHWFYSCWRGIGEWRPSISMEGMLLETQKKALTKADFEALAVTRGKVVTLLMNTYRKRSRMEATRVAYDIVYNKTAPWTSRFG